MLPSPQSFHHSISYTEEQLKKYLLFIICFSAFFFFWALHNTLRMDGGLDLGMISFSTVIASSSFFLYWRIANSAGDTASHLEDQCSPKCFSYWVVVGSHVVVAVNYLLGFIYALTVGSHIYIQFAVYCGSFFVLWLYFAYRVHSWITLYEQLLLEEAFAEERVTSMTTRHLLPRN